MQKDIVNLKKEKNIKKGKSGEEKIINNIKDNFDVYFKVINNTKINNNNQKTEIDIILILSTGIYIIESKNFSGFIEGNINDNKWIQKFYNDKEDKFSIYTFINPIYQNNYHIDMISNDMKIDKEMFRSYIIFSDNIKIPTNLKVMDNEKKVKVINNRDLITELIKDMKNNDISISHEEIDKYYIELKYYREHSLYES